MPGAKSAPGSASAFRPVGYPAAIAGLGTKAPPKCMDFNPGSAEDSTFGIVVPAGQPSLDLQWAEPWYGVETDLSAYLLSASGTAILANNPPTSTTNRAARGAGPGGISPNGRTRRGRRASALVVGRCSGPATPKRARR